MLVFMVAGDGGKGVGWEHVGEGHAYVHEHVYVHAYVKAAASSSWGTSKYSACPNPNPNLGNFQVLCSLRLRSR